MILTSVLIALFLMAFGEYLVNETKIEYEKAGYKWSRVILYSNIAGLTSGLISIFAITKSEMPINISMYFLIFATVITSYVSMQSLMTDLRIKLINRKILRISYLSIYVISVINIIIYKEYTYNWQGLLLFTMLLIFIFAFSSIGASDVRLLAIGIPYSISIEGYSAIILLIFSLLLVALGMFIFRHIYVYKELPKRREKNQDLIEEIGIKEFNKLSRKSIWLELNTSSEHALPVGPFIIIPFLIYLTLYPFFL